MSRVSRNLSANVLAKIVVVLSGLAFVPFYAKLLSIEAFAIAAWVPSLSLLAAILDLGITPTVNRELARLSARPNAGAEMREVARSFEVVVWCLALFLGCSAAGFVPLLLRPWGGASGISGESLRIAAYCTSVVLALQLPAGFYATALLGLQNQVILSAVNASIAVLRGGGAVLLLWLISPTIEAFLLWQAAISITLTLLLARLLWRSLPSSDRRARFSFSPVKRHWRLAAGMSGTSVTWVILTQIDKFILSQVLPLDMFGYYMLGATLASKSLLPLTPVIDAVFPRMTQLAAGGHTDALRAMYRRAVQLIALAILPAVPIFLWFGKDIVTAWTFNAQYGGASGLLTGILVTGFATIALVDVTTVLYWALGRTKIVLWVRGIACIALFPALLGAGGYFGALGSAIAWTTINGLVFLAAVPLVHWYWLAGRTAHWYFRSVAAPLATASLSVWVWSLFSLAPSGQAERIAAIAVITGSAYAAAAISSPISREMLSRYFHHRSVARGFNTPSGED